MKQWVSVVLLGIGLSASVGIPEAMAVQLDWSGQFFIDNNWLNNYQLSRSRPGYDNDQVLSNNGGEYVPGNGEKNSTWYTAFLKLQPKIVVNDSINIKSQFNIGSPINGFLGRGYPANGDEHFNFTNASKDNMSIGAQRYWANLITDFGTFELGRAPISWGLGALWNAGDNLFDRYQNSGDMIRLTSKFGNFVFQPALVKIAAGNNVSGASVGGTTVQGNDDVTDYDLAVKYDNSEEDFDLGMMWTKRTGNSAQSTIFFNGLSQGSTRINFNIFDFYARKKWGHFWFGGELPLFNGAIGAIDGQNQFNYKTVAFIFEGGYTSDMWDVGLKAGHIPGEQATNPGDTAFHAVYLNKDYKLGLIMFNYNLWGLNNNNPDTTANGQQNSPYDNEIVNANYFALNPQLKLDKWVFSAKFVFAFADQVAKKGQQVFNYNRRQMYNSVADQSSFMGWESDLGVSFKWDENFILGWDFGIWQPGNYYEYSNDPFGGPLQNLSYMFASQVRAGVTF